MCITEYDEARTMELFREEGIEEGIIKTLVGLVKKNLISISDAAAEAHMTEAEFRKQLA